MVTFLSQPKQLLLKDISPGLRAVVDFSVTAEEMQQFAAISGDHNPLHHNMAFAQEKGFRNVVVYGALLVAKTSNLIGMQLPGLNGIWSSVMLRFHQPLYVGEPARVEGEVVAVSQATGLIEIKLTIRSNDRNIAKGKAEVLLVSQ